MSRLQGFKWVRIFTAHTIARDLILGLVTIVTLVAGGFIGVNYLILSRQNQAQFQQKTQEYLSYLQDSLASPLWNFDVETIKPIAESMLKNEIVTDLQVFDYKQSPVFKAPDMTRAAPSLINKSVDVLYRNKLAGRVKIVFSSRAIEGRNRQLLVSSLLTLGVILLVLISVTGLLLRHLVGKPMGQVHKAISHMAQGDYQLRAELPPQTDIARIVTQFNLMAEQIQIRQKALTDTNMRFEAILDNATAVFYLKDVEGRYLLVNKRYEELFHVDRKAIIGCTDKDIFPRELADAFFDNDQRVLAADAPIEFEETAPHDDGRHTYLSVKFPLKNSDGQTYAVCGISTDITRRKKAEQEVRKLNQDLELRVERRTNALNQSNQQLKSAMAERLQAEAALGNNKALLLATLESTVDGVLVIQHNKITHTNNRFWQMWGLAKNASSNMHIDAIRSHMKGLLANSDDYLESTQRLYQSDDEALEILQLHDGRVFERFSCPLIINQQNQGRVWCYRDISDKKAAEKAMANAKEAAEAANRAKSDFLASMSHEIRTPMNGVMGMSGLLLETNLDKEQREFAATIQNSAESLLTIINDILDFSKIEAGKLELETADFNLTVVVEEVAEMLALGAHKKGLALGSLVQPDTPQYLKGDPGRLRQIIVNLTSNAIKFTEQGHVAIEVAMDSETETQAVLRFSITDTGIGIPTGRQDRLFKSFSQVDASTTRKFGGTGLGLAISKQLVHLLGGQIGVESAEGQGTTFWFTAQLQKQPHQHLKPSESLNILKGKRILAVDDIRINLDILDVYLKSWGGDVVTAANGHGALHLLKEAALEGQGFDLVIIDSMMPDMDGDEMAMAIQSDPGLMGIKLIRLNSSGKHTAVDGEQIPGFHATITKPIKRLHLLNHISAVLSKDQGDKTQTANHQHDASNIEEIKKQNVRVLVVEDNPTNQKVAKHILNKFGCRTDVAGNGEEAVLAFQQIPYSLILMDVQMPVMDGLTATRKIRELETTAPLDSGTRSPRTPIVALTANVMKGDREKCLAAGMDDFLAKPINPIEVRQVIDHWVGNEPMDPSPLAPENILSA